MTIAILLYQATFNKRSQPCDIWHARRTFERATYLNFAAPGDLQEPDQLVQRAEAAQAAYPRPPRRQQDRREHGRDHQELRLRQQEPAAPLLRLRLGRHQRGAALQVDRECARLFRAENPPALIPKKSANIPRQSR